MASSQSPSPKALVVFKNRIHKELIRSVHVYQVDGGAEDVTEREYLFRENGDYEEMRSPCKVFTLQKFDVSAHYAGMANGVWDCIFAFDMIQENLPNVEIIPEELSISRSPKLASIPSLVNHLNMIYQLEHKIECGDPSEVLPEEGRNEVGHMISQKTQHVPMLDLNLLPCSEVEDEESNPSSADNRWKIVGVVEKKQKRAATRDIARLALDDLAQYFDVPIIEASKNLKVSLTVLKKKCREFGIPRWPHRKIKSLDSLIRDLQGEVRRQQEQDEVAAMAVAKRQRMIESEKESIEKKPFLDIEWETKKFRQDIFKRRHRARALENQSRTLSLF